MREATDISHPSAPDAPATVESLRAALDLERARTREVDHRAKNSLQLVSSLLLLRSRHCAQEEAQHALKAMHQRIGAVAAVHRNLLDGPAPDRFDLTRLVQEQSTALAATQDAPGAVTLALDPVEIDAAAACPLALIFNELMINALTHGCCADRPPAVDVMLEKRPSGFQLAVADAGPGPAAVRTPGFGLTTVRLLAQQIRAGFEIEDAQPGLRAVVTVA
jgi:two-component sensor histidine kinase